MRLDLPMLTDKQKENFWKKVEKIEDGCWPWTGAVSLKEERRAKFVVNKKSFNAARIMYLLIFGAYDNRLEVCHKCDNPNCVNPSHLFLGTHLENVRDRTEKNRSNLPIGEKNGNAKLSWEKVIDIRNDYASSNYTIKTLSEKYEISEVQTARIIRNINWIDDSYIHIPFSIMPKENVSAQKLKREEVVEIKEYLKDGIISIRKIARKFNVSKGTIDSIKKGKSWKYV